MNADPAALPQLSTVLAAASMRADHWRQLNAYARAWAAAGTDSAERRGACVEALADLRPLEQCWAYPGERLLGALAAALADNDAAQFARLARKLSAAILSGDFRRDEQAWNADDDGDRTLLDALPPELLGAPDKPYFEVLIVTPNEPALWQRARDEMRAMRRVDDQFHYAVTHAGSFEDAALAAMVNADVQAVVIVDGFRFTSLLDIPDLKQFLARNLGSDDEPSTAGALSTSLARALKHFRPELDLYLLTDRSPERLAGSDEAAPLRRVFHHVEEPMEVHLALLDGIADRYETPYFDNLKKYALRPIGTFHALPIARGKSIFGSNWIRDMGHFYGTNILFAESSATTGGLDSLLEPTGTIKRAQTAAARAFGAKRAYFGTNGTSTSNKIVVQAVCKPGDIVIVDRNCHKSHHYGMVLSGAQPLYVEAFPMTEYSMYGAVPLATIKRALLDLKAEGRLDKVSMITLTNCTFDGHIYNTRRVMAECLAIKPDLIFLWDEAWFGFARWSPFLRPRTAMGAAAALEQWRDDPAAMEEWNAQVKELGEDLDPKDPRVMERQLVPNPQTMRIRVYETDSVHKSMSSLRQGSIVAVRDEDYDHHISAFHEAVFIHASTSPNAQIIASLDVARRQMELEGYELVMRAIEVALAIRREVAKHPLISKYFSVLGADKMIPEAYRGSGFSDYMQPGMTWLTAVKALKDDEFCLDPTRLTLVCGTAGFDGTTFKNLLASKYNIQLNKTSRNSALLQSNINNTRSDVAALIKVLLEISQDIEARLKSEGEEGRMAFAAKVKSLMEDVPSLPNFSSFHDGYRDNPASTTSEGNMRTAFFAAYNEDECEYLPLTSPKLDERLANGPELVSANFVIPYPPGFPIMVPGQIIDAGTIEFMRKLDVKEIHGYQAARGIKLILPSAIGKRTSP